MRPGCWLEAQVSCTPVARCTADPAPDASVEPFTTLTWICQRYMTCATSCTSHLHTDELLQPTHMVIPEAVATHPFNLRSPLHCLMSQKLTCPAHKQLCVPKTSWVLVLTAEWLPNPGLMRKRTSIVQPTCKCMTNTEVQTTFRNSPGFEPWTRLLQKLKSQFHARED